MSRAEDQIAEKLAGPEAEGEAAEVERLERSFAEDMDAPGDAGRILARRMAVLAVRMDRCVAQEAASLAKRVQQARRECEIPEGAGAAEADRLRALAGRAAMFDPSPEAERARKYEAAAERSFFRALKEIRQLKAEKPSTPAQAAPAKLASTSPEVATTPPVPTSPAPSTALSKPSGPALDLSPASNPYGLDSFYVPIAIGRAPLSGRTLAGTVSPPGH